MTPVSSTPPCPLPQRTRQENDRRKHSMGRRPQPTLSTFLCWFSSCCSERLPIFIFDEFQTNSDGYCILIWIPSLLYQNSVKTNSFCGLLNWMQRTKYRIVLFIGNLEQSRFSQIHNIGNSSNIAICVFPKICSFLLYSNCIVLRNAKLEITGYKRITFEGWICQWSMTQLKHRWQYCHICIVESL